MDEPLADPAAIALYFVSQTASKHVKVALSGEGADEFFGGYNIYREPHDLAGFQKLPYVLRKGLASCASALPFRFNGKEFPDSVQANRWKNVLSEMRLCLTKRNAAAF